ncbi:glutamic acid-rich protein-like [Leptopilina boulardi]|uniref:glutamic acid-rich protein-like n=1 Tax=Leptopilina boulardi TaxID=63433 RepID=UPI0021F5EFC0|nr:glutamic acid-rich protein-like [Leptopilina boulardi]
MYILVQWVEKPNEITIMEQAENVKLINEGEIVEIDYPNKGVFQATLLRRSEDVDEKKVKKNGSEINTTKINNHRKEKDQFDNKFTKSAPMKKYNDTKLESQSKANKAVLSLKEKSEVETHGKIVEHDMDGSNMTYLFEGSKVLINKNKLFLLKRFKSNPRELTRKLMLELVGAEKLKTMTAQGKKGNAIPEEIRIDVFKYVQARNKNFSEFEFTTVLNYQCGTLRNPKLKKENDRKKEKKNSNEENSYEKEKSHNEENGERTEDEQEDNNNEQEVDSEQEEDGDKKENSEQEEDSDEENSEQEESSEQEEDSGKEEDSEQEDDSQDEMDKPKQIKA